MIKILKTLKIATLSLSLASCICCGTASVKIHGRRATAVREKLQSCVPLELPKRQDFIELVAEYVDSSARCSFSNELIGRFTTGAEPILTITAEMCYGPVDVVGVENFDPETPWVLALIFQTRDEKHERLVSGAILSDPDGHWELYWPSHIIHRMP